MAEQRNTRRVLRTAPPRSAVGGGTPGGGNGTGGMSNSASPVSTTLQTEDDEGNRRRGVENKGEAQVDILAARGVLRPLEYYDHCIPPPSALNVVFLR